MKRLLSMVATILVITTLTFVMMKVIPGSPFNEERNTNEAVQRNLEAYYHLDEPLFVQYLFYLKSIVAFDFGPSIKQPSQSVNDMLSRGFPVSFELGMTSLIIAILSGIALGIFAALRQNGIIDYAAMTVAVLGISVPNFIMATMLIQQFAVNWNIFPLRHGRARCIWCSRQLLWPWGRWRLSPG